MLESMAVPKSARNSTVPMHMRYSLDNLPAVSKDVSNEDISFHLQYNYNATFSRFYILLLSNTNAVLELSFFFVNHITVVTKSTLRKEEKA